MLLVTVGDHYWAVAVALHFDCCSGSARKGGKPWALSADACCSLDAVSRSGQWVPLKDLHGSAQTTWSSV